jgi:ABC-type multidrug transport system fused ATPase/permease subunit
METLIWIVILAAIVVAAIAVVVSSRRRQRHAQELRDHFAPEYDRTVERAGGPRAAEQELAERERRHDGLELRPLSEETRIDYLEHWRDAQSAFADDPERSIAEADALIRQVMRERGYAEQGFGERIGDVSMDYPIAVERYRAAHDVAIRARVGDAPTEELREALTNFRALFDELVAKSAPHGVR